jgi:hypothetical protein
MHDTNQIKLLPKVEVSFQDDFSGNVREYTLTPKYILSEVRKIGLTLKIGDEILLWEKDVDGENNEYYLCNIGKIVEASKGTVSFSEIGVRTEDLVQIGNEPVLIQIDREGYFELPIDSPVFR